ncbi:MAG: 3'-phosphoadenosine 5'-phosphosulfate (PAPS) 3'-phosphatase [Cyclobacteriaceae bacterium]|jgi:3'-phosphoadenosine 5'-phosphosulfate (PAPS) 3'-phosphatase
MNKLAKRNLRALCDTAIIAATQAGRYIQSQFDQHYITQSKEGGDSLASQVVTEVDIKAQKIILAHLEKSIIAYDLGLLTEELEDDHSRAVKDFFWCIDPMDGTLPFTERRTGYAVSIALISKAGDPEIGVVYIPDLAVCYSAIKGEGLAINNKPFLRDENRAVDSLHMYMDRSFTTEPYFELVKNQLKELAERQKVTVQFHENFGGVRNAIGVMISGKGCYFKFPKKKKGCGSIWDYAATRLFFEELSLPVSNAKGDSLHLNNLPTTFMNDVGILYATEEKLSAFIKELGRKIA